jgi:hypothetical protein
MSFALFWEPEGVVIRFSGVVERTDPKLATVTYEGDPRFDDLAFVIADYSAIAGCIAAPGDMEIVAAMELGAAHTNPTIRKAVVATWPEVIALARHHQRVLQPSVPTEIFATMEEARAWLRRSLDAAA